MRGKSLNIVLMSCLLVLSLGLSGCVGAVAGVGAAAVAAGTTEKGLGTSISDTAIKAKISDGFVKNNIRFLSEVGVSVNEGSVLLTGKVNNPEDKIKITRIAWDVRGVVEVINEIEIQDKSSLKDIAKDIAAAAQLRGRLIADADISSINYSIDVVNGTVFLTGIARSTEEMGRVIDHARSLRFATEVINYIRVSEEDRQ